MESWLFQSSQSPRIKRALPQQTVCRHTGGTNKETLGTKSHFWIENLIKRQKRWHLRKGDDPTNRQSWGRLGLRPMPLCAPSARQASSSMVTGIKEQLLSIKAVRPSLHRRPAHHSSIAAMRLGIPEEFQHVV